MWIVRLALNRPYTFIVLSLLILLLSPAVILRTPTDIFPSINIPVISVVWTYTGLNPEDIEARLTTPYEKGLTTLVDNIQHIESTSYNGVSLVKIYLQPGASLDTANSQVVAAGGFIQRFLPPAIQPPRSSISARPAYPLSNLGSPERECPSRRSMIRGSTFCAPS
jgi:multidrug efflux pump subunit AcrB